MDAMNSLLYRMGVIPVIAIDSVAQAVPLADALLAGGLGLAEITFRTPAAPDAIATIRKERPQLLVGAGTILTLADLHKAKACGAAFAVAPGFNPPVAREARAIGLEFFPGVITPSEIETAMAAGFTTLKLFPAETVGGLKLVKALAGPYGHTNLKLLPLGGLTQENFESYLLEKLVLAVGGTWIAKKESIAAGNWDEIKANCLRASQAVARLRK